MGFTNSPLVAYTLLSPNHSGLRTKKIDRISPHCVVGQCTAEGLGEWFHRPSTQASSNYGMDYDIKISNEDGGFMLYSKVSQEKSGGETQTPFYITIAASFMQLYRNSIGGDSIGLVMMDEAFNNMDDERIAGVLSFMSNSNLQMIIAAPPDKIQYIGPAMKKVLLVLQDDKLSYVEDFSREAV